MIGRNSGKAKISQGEFLPQLNNTTALNCLLYFVAELWWQAFDVNIAEPSYYCDASFGMSQVEPQAIVVASRNLPYCCFIGLLQKVGLPLISYDLLRFG